MPLSKHEHTADCIGLELRGVYDGVSVWQCPDGYRNRWADYRDESERRRFLKAQQYIAMAVALAPDGPGVADA